MKKGYIEELFPKKHHGYIYSEELDSPCIHFNYDRCIDGYKHLNVGDRVKFMEVTCENDRKEAREVTFVGNPDIEWIIKKTDELAIHTGFLKHVNDHYFVQDVETQAIIQIIISHHEINIKENYEHKINHRIYYNLHENIDGKGFYATSYYRTFHPDSHKLLNREIIRGNVFKEVNEGYLIRIFNNMHGLLPYSSSDKAGRVLSIGDKVNVICIKSGFDFNRLDFDLQENVEADNKLNIKNQIRFMMFKEGGVYLGKVKDVIGAGVIIKFENTFGILELNQLLKQDMEEHQHPDHKQIYKIMKECFPIDQRLVVTIYNIHDQKIKFSWDVTEEPNKTMYKNLMEKYNQLKSEGNLIAKE